MAYVSLYRKYRPQSFDEVVGQDTVTRTLANAISEGRLHHAYLFTGPRGTGKTSTARILAKAVNCEQGPTPTPCNACDQCREITDGSSVDVIELDMASHGGVDDARELRERALFAPARARRKVYILDEVHMASTAAFNALLKLVEEPPGHVLFAMATTDPQKVLPTILSRVQRLDLRRVSAADLAAHVRRVCEAEGRTIDDEAVETVVQAGDGSVRDTLSVLEHVLAYGDARVTAEAVGQALGRTPAQHLAGLTRLLATRDVAGLLSAVQDLVDEGHDLRRFTLELVGHLRDLLVLQVAPARPDLVDATEERRALLVEQAPLLPRETLLRAVRVLADTLVEQRQGPPRLPLELALAGLATPGADGDAVALADRVARLEAALASGGSPSPSTPAPSVPVPSASDPDPLPVDPPPHPPDPVEPATPPDPVEAPDSVEASASVVPPDLEDAPGPVESSAPVDVPDPVVAPVRDEASAGVEATDPVDAPDPVEPVVAAVPAPAEPSAPSGGNGAGEDELAVVQRQWAGVLDLVKQRSRSGHAIYLPATPVRAGRGILTLRYGRRYASFHAANARKAEFADVLQDAVRTACGLTVRIDVIIEGEDERRRPLPPLVTADDGETFVPERPTPPRVAPARATDEEVEVREAELGGTQPAEDVDQLLASELGAQLVDERPAP